MELVRSSSGKNLVQFVSGSLLLLFCGGRLSGMAGCRVDTWFCFVVRVVFMARKGWLVVPEIFVVVVWAGVYVGLRVVCPFVLVVVVPLCY